jgi:hypothetical protein
MAAKQRSQWFQKFVDSVRAPMVWTQTDEYGGVGALHLLEGDERTEAEDILFERLTHNDGRAAYALADIGSTRAIEPLRACLSRSIPGLVRLAATRALHQLGDDSGHEAAIDVLRNGNAMERHLATSVLSLFGGAEVEQALEGAVDDPDSDVRSAAAGKLVKLRGLSDFNRTYQDRLGLLQNRLSSPLATVRADALAELHDIFDRHQRGESLEQLGLTWRADDEQEPILRFVKSLQGREAPWQDDFAVDVIVQLTGQERRWAEDCLWHFLPTDPRAARAFARLGVTRAIAPLREVAQTATGAVAIEVAAALWKLSGDADAFGRLRAAAGQADSTLATRAQAALGEPPQ